MGVTPNYAFKPIAEQALGSNQTVVPQRLNAALGLTEEFVVYSMYRKTIVADDEEFKFTKAVSLFGCNARYIPKLLRVQLTQESTEPLYWRINVDEALTASGEGSHGLVIDLKPNNAILNLSLYEVAEIWGVSSYGWTPIMLRLRALFVDSPREGTVTDEFTLKTSDIDENVFSGSAHTCALYSGGAVCWGQNTYGQLGNGFTHNIPSPVTVIGSSGATAITAGAYHSCVVVSGGAVKCWGRNEFGQIGDGTNLNRLTAVSVVGVSNAIAIAAGDSHTCVVIAGGTVKCWGLNNNGQLGNGTTINSSSAVNATGVTGATAISSHGFHSCVIAAGGTVKCWGRNGEGQLGNGTFTNSSTSVNVGGIVGATVLAAGGFYTCAIVGGLVRCWGDNFFGQLGDGSTTPSASAVAVAGVSAATALSAGIWHTCAVVSGGNIKCWGYNGDGQLGNGSTNMQAVSRCATSCSSQLGIFHRFIAFLTEKLPKDA